MDVDDEHKHETASQSDAPSQESQDSSNSSSAAAAAAAAPAAAASAPAAIDASSSASVMEEDKATMRAVMASPVVSTDKWKKEADAALRAAVAHFDGRNWKAIAQRAFGTERTAVQCLHRYTKVLKPGLLKGPWSVEEDDQLRKLVAIHSSKKDGTIKWSKISESINGRLGKQCRERWISHLNPTIVTTEWTNAETEILRKGYQELGPKWAMISKRLPGRTDNAVKNWYNSFIKKQVPASPLGATSAAAAVSPYAASAAAASSSAGSSTPGSVSSSSSARGGASVLSPLSMSGSVQSAATASQRTQLVATKSKRPLQFPARPADSVHHPRALGLGPSTGAGAGVGGAASYPGDPNAVAASHYPAPAAAAAAHYPAAANPYPAAAAAVPLAALPSHSSLVSPSRAVGEALLAAGSSAIPPGTHSVYSLELAALDAAPLHPVASAAGLQSVVENSPLKPETSQRHARIVRGTSRRTLARVDGLIRRKNAAAIAAEEAAAAAAAAAAQAAASAHIAAAAGSAIPSAPLPFVPHAWPADTPIVAAPFTQLSSSAATAAAAAAPTLESQQSVVSFAATTALPVHPLEDDADPDADLPSNQWIGLLTASNVDAPQTPTPHRTDDEHRMPPVPATPPPSYRRYYHAAAAPGSGSSASAPARTAPNSGSNAVFGRAGGLSLSPPPFDRSHTGRLNLFETPVSSADKRAVKSFLVSSPGSATRSPATAAAAAAAAAPSVGLGSLRMMPIAESGAGSSSSFNSPSLPVTSTPTAGSKRGNASLTSSTQSSPSKQQLQPGGLTRAGSDDAMLSRDSGATAAGGSGAGVSKRARLGPDTLLHTTACSECGERVLDKLAPATPATALAHCMIGSPGCRTCAHRLNRHVHSPPEATGVAAPTAAALSSDRKSRTPRPALMATFEGMGQSSDELPLGGAAAGSASAAASSSSLFSSSALHLSRDPLYVDASRHEQVLIERKEQADATHLKRVHDEVKRSLQQRALSRSPSRSPLKLHNPRVAAVLMSGGKRSSRDPSLAREQDGERKQQEGLMDETEE